MLTALDGAEKVTAKKAVTKTKAIKNQLPAIMTTLELATFYQRELQQLMAEINLFKHEDNIWKTTGTITNTAGNLTLHIIGGLSYHIGSTLANTGYIRNRDQEFTAKDIPRTWLTNQLQDLVQLIKETIIAMPDEKLNDPHPQFFDKENATIGYVLTQLLLHLNYHTGQVNYLRRALE